VSDQGIFFLTFIMWQVHTPACERKKVWGWWGGVKSFPWEQEKEKEATRVCVFLTDGVQLHQWAAQPRHAAEWVYQHHQQEESERFLVRTTRTPPSLFPLFAPDETSPVHSAKGWSGIYHKFTHPWFQTIIMFIGEALCIFGYLI
jgi:hypothetical protein